MIGPDYQGAVYTPYPFENMLKLGMLSEARQDKAYDALDKMTGLMAFRPAPGHEQYKDETMKPFKEEAANIVNTLSPNNPQFFRRLNTLKNSYYNHPDVQNLVSSKETYDKVWLPIMSKVIPEQGVIKQPGIYENNQWKQNRQQYTNLNYVPYENPNIEIDKQLNQVHAKIANTPGVSFVTRKDSQGNSRELIKEGNTEYEYKDYPLMANAIASITKEMKQKSTGGANWYDANFLDGLDDNQKTVNIYDYVTNRAIPHFYDNKIDKINYSQASGLEPKEDKTPFNFTLPGISLQTSDPTSTSYGLQTKAEEISKSIPALEKDLATKRNSGQYAQDDKYLIGLDRSIQAKKEMVSRYKTAFDTEVNKVLAGNTLTSNDKVLYQKYKDFKFEQDLLPSEIQSALNFNKELKKGLDAVSKVVETVTKNINLNNKNLISPGVVLSKSKTLNQEMDDFVERAIPSSNLYDPNTMDLMKDEDINNAAKTSYAGYTERPVAGFGRMIAVQLKDKDNKTLRTAYMEAPLNFKDFLARNDRGSLEELDIQDNLAEIKDNPLFPGGNILIEGKNYGRLEIPQRKSPDDPTADSNPDLVMWRDPNGILHQTDIITLSKTLSKLKQIKQ